MSALVRRGKVSARARSAGPIAVRLAERRSDLVELTYPACRHLLEGSLEDVIAVEAIAADQVRPVGLVLGLIDADRQVELLSLFVESNCRRRGVGRALMGAFINAARQAGAVGLHTAYQTGTGFSDAFERILHLARWAPPGDRMLAVRCRVADLANGAWRRTIRRAAGVFECSTWVEVDAGRRAAVHAACHSDRKVTAIDPTRFDSGCDPDTSLAAWRAGRVVGWCITHRFGTLLRVTCAGALTDRASTVVGFLMYDKLAQRAREVGVEELMWTVPLEYQRYAALIERRVRPIATLFERVRAASFKFETEIPEENTNAQEADHRQAA